MIDGEQLVGYARYIAENEGQMNPKYLKLLVELLRGSAEAVAVNKIMRELEK